MNKLKKLKNKLAKKTHPITDESTFNGILQDGFKDGFDAVIALDLPVKFAEWKVDHPFNMKNRALWLDIIKKVGHNTPSTSELYQYWIDNIFKPK